MFSFQFKKRDKLDFYWTFHLSFSIKEIIKFELGYVEYSELFFIFSKLFGKKIVDYWNGYSEEEDYYQGDE